jgi:transcription elongation factor GreA
MTPAGYSALRQELLRLKSSRAELATAIEIARGHGDLSENGDYDAAKEKSGMVEAKIRDLEAKLAEAEVIDPLKLGEPEKVVFGTTVVLEDLDSGDTKTFTIVGADESDIKRGYISFDSPIGKALIGKLVGDTAKVQAPGGVREYEVCDIRVDYSAEASVE